MISAIALAAAVTASCSWDRPGDNKYTRDVPDAVDNYKDIPASTRAELKRRMRSQRYDDVAAITRDAVVGKDGAVYGPELTDMHFGTGQVCRTVSRAKWTKDLTERGLVYCADGHCLIVPTVCRNVSRIKPPASVPATPPRRTALAAIPEQAEAAPPAPAAEAHEAVGPGLTAPHLSLVPLPIVDAAPTDTFAGATGGQGVFAPGVVAVPFPVTVPAVESNAPTAPVPEPAAWVLTLVGLAAGALKFKRSKQ